MTPETTQTFTGQGTSTNPFPGLRPFDFEESHLFFGRDGQSEQLISKLGATHFLAAVGTSGSGKSSLVRAGLMPALFGGFMTSAGSNWRIAVMRPGSDPIGNLARALNSPDVFGSEIPENAALQIALTEASLLRGSRGLVDAVRQAMIARNENLLVLVDQFEEIFRFARVAETQEYRDEAAAFVKLLLEAAKQRELPIYVALTMRSDYLGDCSQFWGLPEAINESQYLIPRLTRDQLKEAITGPISVAHGNITPRLVARLLNDVGDNQDQLPVLQHLLMRMWDEWEKQTLTLEHVEAGNTITVPHRKVHSGGAIDLCCYEAVGGMANALSRHADEALSELRPPSQRVAERLFKALTEKGSDNREIRRPVTLGVLCALAKADQSEVVGVIETFRRPGRSFVMTPAGSLSAESLIDISHESLIRAWTRLKEWVEEESRSARIYKRLAETAVLEAEGKASLWRDPDLQIALTWRQEAKPNQAWAQRYHPEFDRAMDFLDRSVKERDAAIREKELQRKRAIKRTRLTAIFFGFLFLVSLVALFFANQQRVVANQEREKADGLRKQAEQNAEDAKNNARKEEEARLATQVAEQERKAADQFAKESAKLAHDADVQRQEALKQKGIAEAQTKKVIELQRKAEQQAADEQEINTLTRQISDDLNKKNVDGVIKNAKTLVEHYQKKSDSRGEFENQTLLATAYLQSGNNTEARDAAQKALTLHDNNQLENSRLQHENLIVLIEAYLKQADGYERQSGSENRSELNEALRNALLALRIQEGSFGPKSRAIIPDLVTMATVLEKLKRNGTAITYREKIVDVQKEAVRANNVELATAIVELAKFEQKSGRNNRAAARFQEALKIQESLFGLEDPQLVPTLNSLAEVYRLDKKDSEADLVVQRIQRLQGKDAILRKGASGPEVRALQERLLKLRHFQGSVDGYFGPSTEAAVIKFQTSKGLQADGIVGPGIKELLDETKALTRPSVTGKVTVEVVQQMFPSSPIMNIQASLPGILRALEDAGLSDEDMVLMALVTLNFESGGTFAPTTEQKTRFNTSPNGHPFDLYDKRNGNQGPPEGERFKGRGYIQLTGRANYDKFGRDIGLEGQLVEYPELANDPAIAARVFVQLFKNAEARIREPLTQGDLGLATRRLVGGGYTGARLDQFKKAFEKGKSLIQ
ncbi:MAG TPA: peptidoglycan-binding protein [Pyrinomonadaceae bacterium]|nr:peptidoglycan-binding protein [Pyrinomonadaceae bacterium]